LVDFVDCKVELTAAAADNDIVFLTVEGEGRGGGRLVLVVMLCV